MKSAIIINIAAILLLNMSPALACIRGPQALYQNTLQDGSEPLPECLGSIFVQATTVEFVNVTCDRPIKIEQINCDKCGVEETYTGPFSRDNPTIYTYNNNLSSPEPAKETTFGLELKITFGDKDAMSDVAFDDETKTTSHFVAHDIRYFPPGGSCPLADESTGCSALGTSNPMNSPLAFISLTLLGFVAIRRTKKEKMGTT